MSVIISTPAQICNHQLNASKSKSLYSFPKSERFNNIKKPLCDQFYDLPDQKDKRKTAFGYGNKSDFTNLKFQTPAPTKYQIKTEIDTKLQKKQGWFFGESRGKMANGSIWQTHLIQYPGFYIIQFSPGTYKEKSQLSNIQYSMRPKTANPEEFTTQLKNPGPGAYENYNTIHQKGSLFVSKYKSSGATTINPAHSKRFVEKYDNNVPGPGQYSIKMRQMSANGSYYVQQFKNSMVRTFAHNERHGIMQGLKEKIKTPGVGEYQLPSEFGHYEAKKK